MNLMLRDQLGPHVEKFPKLLTKFLLHFKVIGKCQDVIPPTWTAKTHLFCYHTSNTAHARML